MKGEKQLAVVAILLGGVLSLSGIAFGAGFGLYEASSASYALGGAVMGRAVDASANFYNPATLTDLTNITVTVGAMTEHPRGRIKINGGHTASMNPGVYVLPHFHLAVPLPFDFAFGLGIMPEYGLGSKYNASWDLANNSQKTEVTSFTVNPNLAYKITDKWSVGAGLRWIFFDFEQDAYPVVEKDLRAQIPGYVYSERFNSRLKGDNAMRDFGWQIGTKYDVFDNFSVGLTYKSRTLVRVHGKTELDATKQDPYGLRLGDRIATAASGDASTELMLPQSLTGGFNWDITPKLHLGGVVAWTEWSSVDTLRFDLPTGTKPIRLEWEDTWRFGLAPSYDITDDWTALCSYVYETDCNGSQNSTMLPPSQRHMISLGVLWHALDCLDLSLTYGAILMDEGESECTDAAGKVRHYHAERGISHAAGLTVTYRF